MVEFVTARELYDIVLGDLHSQKDSLEYVELEGWVRTNRNNGHIGFIELNDGSYFRNVQIVYTKDEAGFDLYSSLNTGDAIHVMGCLKITEGGKQPFEILSKEIKLLAKCAEDYPLQKKRHSFEFLREIAHLRPKANTFLAVFRVRSVLSMAIHEFFQNQGFVYVHGPIITANDAEGAGETFTVTTRNDGDYENDFFGKKDANEFWMIEPEMAFADLEDDMLLIEDMVKYCIDYVIENCPEEMNFFNTMIDKGLLERLQKVSQSTFAKMTYTEAIKKLQEAVDQGHVFENKDIFWGMDLNSEHEKYLCEQVVNGPLFLIDFPKELKSFYMKINPDGKTVAACDLLVPHIGELVGGSQREENYDALIKRMQELNMNTKGLEWYLDLRRFGGAKSAGFGLGFERMVMYLTGMQNIRDVIPFPRTVKNCMF